MFFNVSNRPCFIGNTTWTTKQVQAANNIAGEVIDFGFPAYNPDMTNEQMAEIAHATALDVVGMYRGETGRVPSILHKDVAAMVSGHPIMTMLIVSELQDMNVPCYMMETPDPLLRSATLFRKYPEMIVGGDKIAMAIAQG